MTKKKKQKNREVEISFLGSSCAGVTQSCYKLTFWDCTLKRKINILLEMGIKQDGTIRENYRDNYNLIKSINPNEIDYIGIFHAHGDHSFLVPAIAKCKDFKGEIFCTHATKMLLHDLWYDCTHINQEEVKMLQSRGMSKIKPYYIEQDVYTTMLKTQGYDYNKVYNLTPNIWFKLLPNNHITGASSVMLYFRDETNRVHTLYYSSDLYNTSLENYFTCNEQKPPSNCNMYIIETTYGSPNREHIDKRMRKKEINIMTDAIKKTILEKRGDILIPCFSLHKTPMMLKILKDILDTNEELKDIQVVVDGRLSNVLLETYKKILNEEQLEMLNEILEWKNLRRIREFKQTRTVFKEPRRRIILSSQGFGQVGHITYYLSHMLGNERNTVLCTGYAPEHTPIGKLKEGKKLIKVDDKMMKVEAEVVNFKSFSAHIQHQQLLSWIPQTRITDAIVLVHGDSREEFKEILEEKLSSCCITTKVYVAKKNSIMSF